MNLLVCLYMAGILEIAQNFFTILCQPQLRKKTNFFSVRDEGLPIISFSCSSFHWLYFQPKKHIFNFSVRNFSDVLWLFNYPVNNLPRFMNVHFVLFRSLIFFYHISTFLGEELRNLFWEIMISGIPQLINIVFDLLQDYVFGVL